MEDPLEERPVAPPVEREDPPRRPGVHRRVDVAEGPLVGRQLPRWGACTTRGTGAVSWCLAKAGSTWARATQWNARSQAANQGYSHVSGIEMMSWSFRCRQPALRPRFRDAGGGRLAGVAVEPAATS